MAEWAGVSESRAGSGADLEDQRGVLASSPAIRGPEDCGGTGVGGNCVRGGAGGPTAENAGISSDSAPFVPAPDDGEPAPAGLQPELAGRPRSADEQERSVGGGHHVHSAGGPEREWPVRLFGAADGPVVAADRGLGVWEFDGRGLGAGVLETSDQGTSADAGIDPSHGSGRTVRGETLPRGAASCGNASEHERGGELLRQCVHGVVLRDGQDGTGAGGVRRGCGGGPGDLGVHSVLQRRFILPHLTMCRKKRAFAIASLVSRGFEFGL